MTSFQKFSHALILSLFIMFSAYEHAIPHAFATSLQTAEVDNLLLYSGILEQYGDIQDDVRAGLLDNRESFPMLSDEDFKYLVSRVLTVFDPEEVLEGIRKEVLDSLSTMDITLLMQWYQSDLGKKITALEVEASTRESHRKMTALKELQLKKKERVAFAEKFDDLLNLSDFSMEYYRVQQNALINALIEIMGEPEQVNIQNYKDYASGQEPEVRKQAEEMVTVSVVFTYRRLTDSELEEYYNFNSKQYTLKLSQAVFTGAIKAMRASLVKMASGSE